MPATESTKYNLSTMHVVFGVTSLVMLGTVIWMFVADHNREWKPYQAMTMRLEDYGTQLRIDELNNPAFKAKTAELQQAVSMNQFLGWYSKPTDAEPIFSAVRDAAAKQVAKLSVRAGGITATEKLEEGLATLVKNAGESRDKLAAALKLDLSKPTEAAAGLAKLFTDDTLKDQRAEMNTFVSARASFIAAVNDLIKQLSFAEKNLLETVKDQTARQGKAAADRDQAINKGADPAVIAGFQDQYNVETLKLQGGLPAGVDPAKPGDVKPVIGLVQQLQQAKSSRERLQTALADFLAPETLAAKELSDHLAKVKQLEAIRDERANNLTKVVLSAPIVDAFGGTYKPDQIWLPDLPQPNGSFGVVARFDRCVTCHTGISKTAPGSAVEPGYAPSQTFEVALKIGQLPEDLRKKIAETREQKKDFVTANELLAQTYGIMLAEQGLFAVNDPTISVITPGSLAAEAGLGMGDVISKIGRSSITTRNQAETTLLDEPSWTKPADQISVVKITVSRGVPQPYCSHPRMDLFVGSMSPHPVEKFGCTICHQGQGSGTMFKWTSHAPNSLLQEKEWGEQQGWFDNHHWIYPMLPKRFQEASCLKCHHDVVELMPSRRFPDAPAAKLMHGYETIREYGCFGCHEINGYDGPSKRLGPDMRIEPAFYAAAAQLLADPGLPALAPDAPALAKRVVNHPEDDKARRSLQVMVAADAAAAEQGKSSTTPAKLQRDSHRLAEVLKDVEIPGEMRKVGPSLRYVADKVGYNFLYDWIRNPTDFRPTTKMPRFFGLHDHLEGAGLDKAIKFEDLEIRGMTEYLLTASQQYDAVTPAQQVEAASLERGKKVFEVRGCLACHQHDDFPAAKSNQGPHLSRIAEKLAMDNPEQGKKWLYSWVREPNRYHSRTVMPNLYLEPYAVYKQKDGKDEIGPDGKPIVDKMVDPTADVVAYLMTPGAQPWTPAQKIPARADLPKTATADNLKKFTDQGFDVKLLSDLEALAYEHLLGKYNKVRAAEVLQKGVKPDTARGDDLALVGMTAENRTQKLLEYVGRRSINKYGCFGCHDIPGYEDAKPIGAALADWGRKDPAKLAFENISAYVHDVLEHGHGAIGQGKSHAAHGHTDHSHAKETAASEAKPLEPVAAAGYEEQPAASELKAESDFLKKKLLSATREGFLWNKLHRPRSYDYKKTETKSYNDKYRMPQFRFAVDQTEHEKSVEAVMTFVLGLVSEPPPAKYVYTPSPRQKAIVTGKKLLDKYNCGGCHMLEMERWELTFKPGTEDLTLPGPDHEFFPFHKQLPSAEQVSASQKTDAAGRVKATLIGMAKRDPVTGELSIFDEDDAPIEDLADIEPGAKIKYQFDIYEPTVVNGEMIPVTARPVVLTNELFAKRGPGDATVKVWPSWGGDLTKLLFPVVLKDAATPPANKAEALGWLPPTLNGEGRKVQTQWLHDFLLDPHPIRPAAVLRMPKFNMTSREAMQFAEYFAAVDNVPYPYEPMPDSSENVLTATSEQNEQRMQDAVKIITSNGACVKCHLIGDYSPGGDPKALGPQLSRVHKRLRPDYLKGWIANPNYYLPYTGMLKVIQYDKPSDVIKSPGNTPGEQAENQLRAVTDYFLNFDSLIKSEYKFSKLVPAPAASATEQKPPAQ